jgi:hypothetical protein
MLMRRIQRLSRLPEYEPLLNQLAMTQLQRSAATVARLLRPGEQILEVFHLRPGLVWWALTSERLLGFNAALGGSALQSVHELADVKSAANSPRAEGWKQRLVHAGSDEAAWLRIEIDHAPPLAGTLASPTLAARVIERINQHAAARRGTRPPMRAAPAKPDSAPRRRRAALASLWLPGLGHWQLGHGSRAVVFFVVFAATLIFVTVPMLWTLVEPFTGVSAWHAAALAVWHLLLGALAAADAWRTEPAAGR